jgi:hypothetical protein
LGDDAGLQVVVDVDLGDLGGSNIGDIEVPGLGAEAGPARRRLAVDREARGLAGGDTGGSTVGEVDNVNTEAGVGREDGVLARNNGHAERQETALGGLDGLEVLREGAVRGDVPDGEDTRGGRDALDRRDELLVVLREDNVADGASGASRGAGQGCSSVCDALQNAGSAYVVWLSLRLRTVFAIGMRPLVLSTEKQLSMFLGPKNS